MAMWTNLFAMLSNLFGSCGGSSCGSLFSFFG